VTPHQQPNNSVVVLGAGRGLTSVLRALRGADIHLTVIVSMADTRENAEDPQQPISGPGVEELRRSLEALSREGPLLRAIRRPLTVDRLGRHPLGDLTLASAAAAFGDYSQASIWLGEQLGIDGAVLSATIAPTRHEIKLVDEVDPSKSSRGRRRTVRKLQFVGDRARSPDAAIAAINDAQWVLLAPGALYRSVLATAAVPDLSGALESTSARVVWIANLEPDPLETPDLTAIDHLFALKAHGVRVDVVLHDRSAGLKFSPAELKRSGAESVSRELASSTDPTLHDPEQLRLALNALLGSRPTPAVRS
jgi:uncharacterized cofD-like protein